MYFTISPTATAQPETTATSSCMTTNRVTMTHAQYFNNHNITTITILQQAQYYQVPIQQKQQCESDLATEL